MLVKINSKNNDFTDSEFAKRFLLPPANVDGPDETIIFIDLNISVRIVQNWHKEWGQIYLSSLYCTHDHFIVTHLAMDKSNNDTYAVPLNIFIWGANISLHTTSSLQVPVVRKDVQLQVMEKIISLYFLKIFEQFL